MDMEKETYLHILIDRFRPYVHFDLKPLIDICLKDEQLVQMPMNERDAAIMYAWRMASTLVEELCMSLEVAIMKKNFKKEKE